MATKSMVTAKEIAFKAYKVHITKDTGYGSDTEIQQRFESWWSDNFIDGDHKDSFRPEINIYVGNRRYIKAE